LRLGRQGRSGQTPIEFTSERLQANAGTPSWVASKGRDANEVQAELSSGLAFELAIDSFFGASHAMRPSGERHTHSFRVQASFTTETVDDDGMVCGLREVSDLLDTEARKYMNRFLNDMPPFDVVQPTGENLASVIYRDLRAALTALMPEGPRLVAVTLWENPTSFVRVGPAAV
jgi:6-pyruvoyltetrahydropterin/6-carboxytetrahydropterin synthase